MGQCREIKLRFSIFLRIEGERNGNKSFCFLEIRHFGPEIKDESYPDAFHIVMKQSYGQTLA